MRILWRNGEAAESLKKVPVLFILEFFAQHNHFNENAANGPNVASFAIALVRQDDLWRPVPSGHYRTGHLAGLVCELVFLRVEKRRHVLLELVVARLTLFRRTIHYIAKFLFP